ncbi:MAG: hypothetical protein ABH884_02795, partial [Candidatus Komeilibacteria bacterium]
MAPGTYYENLYIDTNLIIHSTDGPEETIIDGGGTDRTVYFYLNVDNSTEFSGFTITNGHAGGTNNDPPPIGYGGGILCFGAAPFLSDLIVNNNYGRNGSGLAFFYSLYNDQITTIDETLVINNESIWSTVYINTHSEVNITNCSIMENTSSLSSGGITLGHTSTATIVNTVVYANSGNISNPIIFDSINDPCELTIAYSDIEGGEAGVNTNDNGVLNWLDGNIDADPMLDDEYHLMTGSPCIDAGTAYFEWGEFLLDLQPDDYLGLAPDIGADEYVPYDIFGCLDPTALNFNPDANIDDDSCIYYTGPIWYVSTTGSDDTGSGIEEDPVATIQ